MNYTFDQFLDDSNWTDLANHYKNFNKKVEENIETAVKHDKKSLIRKELAKRFTIKKGNINLQNTLKKELLSGNVVAVDGTCSDYDLLTVGFQARIGIIAINYKNIKSGFTIYISDPFIPFEKETFEEIFLYAAQKKRGSVGVSSSHIKSIMLFKERDFVLGRKEKYKMIQGDIFPYELRTGQGKLRGLSSCLRLGRRLLNEDNIVATQTTTTDPQLRLVGAALEPGEYIELQDYYEDLSKFLNGDEETSPAHFNFEDKETFRVFMEDARNKFVIGVYKAVESNRAYVYYVPKNNSETMVNLLFADAGFQPLRGFSLLLDYADSVCTRLLSTEDFNKQIEAKLARNRLFESEISEKALRRR